MAHNLNFNELTGEYSFFSTKQKAWHGLGKVVAGYPTSAEALVFAGLDFDVIKSPLFTQVNGMVSTPDGINYRNISLDIPDTFATVRTDTNQVLGVVGKDYEIVQNRDAFSFFDSIIGGDGILYETAGALGNGSRIFITAKLPGYIRVGDDDLTEKYIFLTTSHDGSGSITGAFTPPALYVTIRLMMR
jgi:phage/plasmid-like protein (TIGR03299 family)